MFDPAFASKPLLWLLLLVPLAAILGAWIWRRRLQATAAWASREIWRSVFPVDARARRVCSLLSLCLALTGTVLALAQPRWGQVETKIERTGVDVIFVLDTSLSMASNDLPPSRLWVAQTMVRRLVQALPGHRVALVQAEGDGVVMAPLTVDAAVIDLLLDAVLPGSLPKPGTLLAPALERALALFPVGEEKHAVIVLFSDGEDHGSALEKIGTTLRDQGIVLHAVGVGTVEGRPLEIPGAEGQVEYKRDEQGQVVVSRLQEDALKKLADASNGVYLRATGAATNLAEIAGAINGMEKKKMGSETIDALEERFQWPLALAIAFLFAHLLIAPFRGTTR